MTRNARLHLVLPIAAIAMLAGCSSTVGLNPSVSHSGYDGAKVVTINGHGNACKTMVCTGLGAQWRSNTPKQSILVVYVFNHITGITGAQISVDGKEYDLNAMQPFTNFSEFAAPVTESRKGFVVPTELIRKIVASKRTWLRVQTTGGYVEDAVIDGATDSKAYHALKRFLADIDGA